MSKKTNVVFLLADQLRAASLPLYGEKQISTPNIDRIAKRGVTFSNAISTCPLCTPYRAMMLAGRHPQTTGHVINFVGTRHDEIGIGDAFAHAGYKTAWIGKWHLQVGAWPGGNMKEGEEGPYYIPEGRERLGFNFWRGYNMHEHYFNGWVNLDNWKNETWEGYETNALNRYAFQFLESVGDDSFCLFISPHQPHKTFVDAHAPDEYYARLPENLTLPDNVPEEKREDCIKAYRDYLAMILALDDMAGELFDYLEKKGLLENTLFVMTSDHGSQFGAHGISPWQKAKAYEESIHIPLIMHLPGALEGGHIAETLIGPADIFPTLCGLCNVPVPRTVEGYDLSEAVCGKDGAFEQDALLTMNFGSSYCFLQSDPEKIASSRQNIWRGIRTKRYSYFRSLDGKKHLYDIQNDPLQMNNLSGSADAQELEKSLVANLDELLQKRNDKFADDREYIPWFDSHRRIVRNAYGALGSPETPPDWSLLT